MKAGDIIVGIIFISAIIIFIIPFPPIILDLLITMSLGTALVILFNTLYSEEPLDMSLFPVILVFTSLFRVALNVSSTRLILGTGEAGNIIRTFGSFVTGGNLLVGIILFSIIIIVQFIIITKGAERVSEVSARFTLDAMPGKQMAIDADLNSGIIDEKQAKERRQKIQDEASFFGAMDGATKFVKGDAIVGILITFINIIAGIIIGVSSGLPIMEALEKYARLTVGDGLVSQIPALLISVSTAILVTKGTKKGDISDDLRRQLFGVSKVMYMVGGVLLFLGLFVSGLRILLIFGVMAIGLAGIISKNNEIKEIEEEITTDEEDEIEEMRNPENVVNLLQVDPIELEFGYGIIPLADKNQGGDLLDRVVMIRRQIALELGTVVPMIRLRDNIQLEPNEYVIKIKGVEVDKGDIMFDHYMAMDPGYVEEPIEGIETKEPAFELPALWITEAQREEAEAKGYTVVDPPSIMATHLTEIVRRHIHELLSRQDVQMLVDKVKESNPALIEELIPKMMSLGEVQKVLANLLKENVSIRDLVSIFETLADYANMTKDTDMLTEYVRQGIKRAISKRFLDKSINNVITIDPNLEQKILGSIEHTDQGSYISMEPKVTQNILMNLKEEVKKFNSSDSEPIILTAPIVRIHLKKLIEGSFENITVLSYNEVSNNVEVQSIGMVSL